MYFKSNTAKMSLELNSFHHDVLFPHEVRYVYGFA